MTRKGKSDCIHEIHGNLLRGALLNVRANAESRSLRRGGRLREFPCKCSEFSGKFLVFWIQKMYSNMT